jgi:hypothetical protein
MLSSRSVDVCLFLHSEVPSRAMGIIDCSPVDSELKFPLQQEIERFPPAFGIPCDFPIIIYIYMSSVIAYTFVCNIVVQGHVECGAPKPKLVVQPVS